VHVVPLHGKLKDAEAERSALGRAAESQAHRRKDVLAAKRTKSRAQCDMNRMPGGVLWARPMGDGLSPQHRLATGTRTFAAPRIRESKLLLHGAPTAALRGAPKAGDSPSAEHLNRL
jgi:hypothetical protein